MFTRTLLRQSAVRRTPFLPPTAIRNPAYYTTTTRLSAKKGAESRDSISTESTEYSKSGGDGASSSAVDDAAFDPDKTTPEEQYESAKKESGGESENPLNVSPANQEISKPRDAQEGGAAGSKSETGDGGERARTSGGGK